MEMEREAVRLRRADPRSVAELIHLALTEEDEDAAWDGIVVLHYRATREVLEATRALCLDADPRKRTLGANLLGQLGVPERTFPEQCFNILARMLESEGEPEVLDAIAVAFGYLDDARSIPLLAPLSEHADAEVRLGVVHGISRHNDPEAIQLLITLSADADPDVRDWATFGLGSMIDIDTPEVRDALMRRLTDDDDDARGEALVGLARRRDSRVLSALEKELSSESVGLLALEAAEEIGDSSLVPALLLLRSGWEDEQDRHFELLQRALLSCMPAHSAIA